MSDDLVSDYLVTGPRDAHTVGLWQHDCQENVIEWIHIDLDDGIQICTRSPSCGEMGEVFYITCFSWEMAGKWSK